MPEAITYLLIALNAATLVMLACLLFRNKGQDQSSLFKEVLQNLGRSERALKDEIMRAKDESTTSAKYLREELTKNLNSLNESLLNRLNESIRLQSEQLQGLLQNNDNRLRNLQEDNNTRLDAVRNNTEEKLEKLRVTLEERMNSIQENNSKQLDRMRLTVDEKLQATLETRLGQSFKMVSERLEQVHKGIGEMQALASNVGDLKRIMSNVKTRGIWGEIQLGNILEQIFTIEQYEQNVATKPGSNDRVEFAIKLPGSKEDGPLLLPIDSKFPQEDYQRLLDAQEEANSELAEVAAKALESRIRDEAKTICNKYIYAPYTTDFAVLFLPIEGLYAEVLRRPGLYDGLMRDYRVVVCGPTTLSAFLNSLQMGFRTLAIQKRSSEVWSLLGAVKTEFGTFGGLLEKTNKKLRETSNVIEQAARRSRAIERKLKNVEELPIEDVNELLSLEEALETAVALDD